MRNKVADLKVRRERDELFHQLINTLFGLSVPELRIVAAKSGLSFSTLYNNWMYGRTISPRFNSILAVYRACGYEVRVVKHKSIKHKVIN